MFEALSNQDKIKDDIPSIQRALVFQGGGSLGAYEAGVFKTLCKKISHIEGNTKKHLFDVIIGTSIGAINGAILTSSFLKTNNWIKAGEKLEEFWNSVKTESIVEQTLGFVTWWNYWNKISNGVVASGEAARRYYSAKEFLANGAPHIFSSRLENDKKFMDSFNIQYRTNNDILGDFLDEKFVKFPITTNYDKEEPRFLLTSIDVKSGDVVTFDSYNTKTSYGNNPKVIIEYPGGIEKKHLMTSASLPQNSKYHKIKDADGNMRIFWDGSFLSNTPLREIIHHHRHYWHKVRKSEKVPDLEIFIVGLWPKELTDNKIPDDNDFINDRLWDIIFYDKTQYGEKSANMITDYLSFIDKLKEISVNSSDKTLVDKIKKIEEEKVISSVSRSGQRRKYKDIIKGRFRVYVHRVEKTDDTNSIAGKSYDFSKKTIEDLIKIGKKDCEEKIDWKLVETLSKT